MSINFDSQDIAIPCPKCGKQLKEKLGRLKREKHIPCPVCGRIAVDLESVVKAENALNKQLAKLNKKITIKF